MTEVSFDVVDLVGEVKPGDMVLIWPPKVSGTVDGRVKDTRPKEIALDAGPVTIDLDPGPLVVQLRCGGISDTRARMVNVPHEGPVTLLDLLRQSFTYTPPVVSEVSQLTSQAREAADRVGSAEQVGVWAQAAEQSATAAAQVATSLPSQVPPLVDAALADDPTFAGAAANAVTAAVDGLDLMERTTAEGLIDASKWRRVNLTSVHNLDDYVGSAHQGIYGLTSAVGGHPLGTPGWMVQTYDSSSGRTRQTVVASSPTDARSVYRTFSGGTWSVWRPDVAVGPVLTSTSHADDAQFPGYYAVGNSAASGMPENVLGGIQVIPAGTSAANYVQLFVSSEPVPRMWARRAGGEWTRIGEASETPGTTPVAKPEPITWGPVTEITRISSEVAGALSHDRMITFNGVGGPLRQSRDQGRTWEIIHQFPGQSLELVEPLANGEILVATSGTVEGVPSTRRIYISEGYDPAEPTATTWAHKLTGSAQFVKWVDWSVTQHGPIIILAEYGPKGGLTWGSGTEPIEEGLNARYVHLSLDYGQTWSQIFDLNTFMISQGQSTLMRHIHGIAWDPYWDRIWISFGDSMGGSGSNGVIYSDDLGATWEVAYHSAVVDPPEGWQVVGIQPMKDYILFAGDMTPAGVMRLDRAGGKHRDTWQFVEAWVYDPAHKILCHAIRHYETGRGEVALFGFSREGTASPSMVVGTRDGIHWDLLWESADSASPGFRFMVGPTLTGELVAAINRGGTWTEMRGPVDAY